jgi:C4-dicarboxylate transporter DctM subunit
MTTLVLFAIFFGLLAISVPVAVCLSASSIFVLYFMLKSPLIVVAQKFFTAVDSFSLMAIPFFMIAGGLLDKGGVSKRLVTLANALVGWMPGGLAIVVFLASAFFGAISGSSAATVAAIGSIMLPALIKEGYSEDFALATVASAGFLGIIVPPSIPMVIYGLASGTSVGEVFLGGFIPGFLLAGGMSVYAYVYGKRIKNKGARRSFSPMELYAALKEAIWALLMPLIILGGIYGGVFTPTEAAAVASFYGLVVGLFIYRELDLPMLGRILKQAVSSSCMIMFIVAAATVFGLIMTREQIPVKVGEYIVSAAGNKYTFLLFVTVLLFIVGTFMDTVPAVMILSPIFVPVLAAYDISPVAFGVIIIINLGIGLVTPPVGLNLYVAASLRKTTIEKVTNKHLIIYIGCATAILVALMIVPEVITFIPDMMKN